MPILNLLCEEIETGNQKQFWYNNQTKEIFDYPVDDPHTIEDVDLSTKSKEGPFSRIKIQLGLSCNYECSYCSQRFVERAEETSKADIDEFLTKFDKLSLSKTPRIEFWGGEPLVYWKTLKPLAESIRARVPTATFMIITNGSLLTPEIVLWLHELDFAVAISHDGPAQSFRGPDPFDDNFDNIKMLVDLFLPKGKMSFNVMLHKGNTSRIAAINWFKDRFPEHQIQLSEMGLIDAYDDDGLDLLSLSRTDHFNIRRQLWSEMRFSKAVLESCSNQAMAAIGQVKGTPVTGQKCGMDRPDIIAVDLKGNINTCQNVSSVAIAPNGKSHKIGHLDDIQSTRIESATHWTKRPHCRTCPVLAFCSGSCMFLEGDNWYASCAGSFSDKITQLAISVETRTGYVPVRILDESLPLERQDIWGSIFDWDNIPEQPKKKVIPIKAA